jgi:hypothetical protein
MAFICPKCGKPIDDDNILVNQDMALCDACGEMYTISELTAQQSDIQFQSEPEYSENISFEIKPLENETPQEESENLQKQLIPYKTESPYQDIGEIDEKYTKLIRKQKIIIVVLITAIIFGIISIAFAIINDLGNSELQSRYDILFTQNSQLQSRYDNLDSENSQLQSRYNALSADYEILSKNAKFYITSIKCGNWNDNGWLTNPGDSLYSNQMRYLKPRISYSSVINDSITFYIKIIEPNGALFFNSSISPSNFTYSSKINIYRGTNQTADLSGWGNSVSTYRAGEWTVEVWYGNVCLKSEKIRIW